MTLEELRSRLIEACRGKEEFVRPLEEIAEKGMCLSKKKYTSVIDNYRGVTLTTELILCSVVSCSRCPFDTKDSDCTLELDISNTKSYEDLFDWYSETLDLAIASCNGEEVKVEVEEVPVDNPSKPLFIVTKVDDLIGLESEDGKFRIVDSVESAMLYVIGISTHHMYLDFMKGNSFNDEVVACLEELGFRFIIERKKSYLELLEECEPVEFNPERDNYYIGYDMRTRESVVMATGCIFVPGVKYISEKDADKILEECVENA